MTDPNAHPGLKYEDKTAASVRNEETALQEIAALLGRSRDVVATELTRVHGKTLVRNVFGDAFSRAAGEAIEETDDEGSTGIEREDAEAERAFSPYDPDKIRVDPKAFSLKQILDEIEDGGIDLAPDFQRERVWSEKQKVRLIESVLLRIPLPAFYFSQDQRGQLSVVDGLQRLSTIRDFVSGKFSLSRNALEYLEMNTLRKDAAKSSEERCSFAELDSPWRRRLHQTQITANVIDPQTPEQVKFDIFKRINSGGSPLNAQEIRHSMMKPRSRDVLARLASSNAFLDSTPATVHRHRRMADREVVLRLLAFSLLEDVQRYPVDTTMDAFLLEAARKLDDEGVVGPERLKVLEADFERAMLNASEVFGSHAFRKWPVGNERFFPFNKALFKAWGFALRKKEPREVALVSKAIQADARALMSERTFLDAITVSTGDVNNVRRRFEAASTIVAKHLP